jgi:hypothetical protein
MLSQYLPRFLLASVGTWRDALALLRAYYTCQAFDYISGCVCIET